MLCNVYYLEEAFYTVSTWRFVNFFPCFRHVSFYWQIFLFFFFQLLSRAVSDMQLWLWSTLRSLISSLILDVILTSHGMYIFDNWGTCYDMMRKYFDSTSVSILHLSKQKKSNTSYKKIRWRLRLSTEFFCKTARRLLIDTLHELHAFALHAFPLLLLDIFIS